MGWLPAWRNFCATLAEDCPMHIVYLGKYDPEYDRNAVIRAGLAAHGVTVLPCCIREGHLLAQYGGLWRAAHAADLSMADAIMVAEFNQFVVPMARALAWRHRIPLIFDPLVSLYDSEVGDRAQTTAGSLRARRLHAMDWLSMRLADVVLADTSAHAMFFRREFGLRAKRVAVVPVGARTELFRPQPSTRDGSGDVHVLFWGSYIPLQGVEHIVRAAHLLREHKRIAFTLIGRGQTYEHVRRQADQLELPRLRFEPPIPRPELARRIVDADICLGILGNTAKAARVVPNKVYQGLAMARPVITADSGALREFMTPGKHLITVPAADPEALAEALLLLADDPNGRHRLAQDGHAHFCRHFTPEQVGARVIDIIREFV